MDIGERVREQTDSPPPVSEALCSLRRYSTPSPFASIFWMKDAIGGCLSDAWRLANQDREKDKRDF